MRWFRLYNEFAHDPKVQSMPEEMQRRLVMLYCLQCEGCLGDLGDDELALALRIDRHILSQTKELFLQKKFITENWKIRSWAKRQMQSDSSTLRMQRHRDKLKRHRDVTVTTPDTDTDTDTDKKPPIPPRGVPYGFDEFWKSYPRKVGRGAAEKVWIKIKPNKEMVEKIIGALCWQKEQEQWTKDKGQFIPFPSTWLNQRRWEDEPTTKAEETHDYSNWFTGEEK